MSIFDGMPRLFVGAFGDRKLIEYTERNGQRRDIRAIFDAAYQVVELNGNAPVESIRPVLHCEHSIVPNVRQGEYVIVKGTRYRIRGVQPDGKGMVVLILEARRDGAE